MTAHTAIDGVPGRVLREREAQGLPLHASVEQLRAIARLLAAMRRGGAA